MNYSFYLFSKLFDNFYPTETPYDFLFEEVCRMYEDYLKSPYDNPKKDEYSCMVDYLNENVPNFKLINL
jgi:hypothetical protein